jgi:SAM-dependent methyltransferase
MMLGEAMGDLKNRQTTEHGYSETIERLRRLGALKFLREMKHRIIGERPVAGFVHYRNHLANAKGLEIGGPSNIFSGKSILPLYDVVGAIDNCNFSSLTVWEGAIQEGRTYRFSRNKTGEQFICEGAELDFLQNESYDFVLSSHVLEHMGNPLKALYEWKRVLKNHGVLLLCAPDKDKTFDHRRPATSLDHLIEDYRKNTDEHDSNHLLEILELHDLSMDPGAGTREEFVERSRRNFENRCLHHHVFTLESLVKAISYVGFNVLMATLHPPHHIVVICEKVENS